MTVSAREGARLLVAANARSRLAVTAPPRRLLTLQVGGAASITVGTVEAL